MTSDALLAISVLSDRAFKSSSSEADAWTAGSKYLLNPKARIMLNYVHTEFDTSVRVNRLRDDNEDAVVLRAQYDF